MFDQQFLFGVVAWYLFMAFLCVGQDTNLPSRLENCTPETASFLAARQDAIQAEIATRPTTSWAGVYHAWEEGGLEWFVVWAPRTGFVAYFIPDAPCPADVSFGNARFERGRVLLQPHIALSTRHRGVFATEYLCLRVGDRKYLVSRSQERRFRRWRRTRQQAYGGVYLAKQPYSDSFWRDDPAHRR